VACFTGGVDSFFTLLKHQDEITSLVYVHGFDIPLTRTDAYEQTVAHLRTVADDTGKNLIEMSTNLKSFLSSVRWGPIAHGPALASVAMLLTREHGTFLIPATHTYSDSFPWGSHPLLDPLWSTENVAIVHDGAEATRVRKTVALGQSPVAQQHLRVCWKNTGAYNCGVCEKCYRTKICLRLAGTLGQFHTFEDPNVDPDVVRRIVIHNANALSFTVENRDFALEVGDVAISEALNAAIAKYWRREPRTRQLVRDKKRLVQEIKSLRSRKSVRLADALGSLIAPVRRRKSS
ncbi:hypothetical protein, partial [Salinibacterium sp. SWN139]|uniref:hypothetical protein n=1 Tax=Salinibacterium sp. SWN139 TaxID=2792055 RepID=UPI001E58EE69